jgi:hypothetical protein
MKKANDQLKLTLARESVKRLEGGYLGQVRGGFELRDQKYTPKCPPYTEFTCTCIG